MHGAFLLLTVALTAGPGPGTAQDETALTEAEAARLIGASPAIVGRAGRSFERVVEMLKLETGSQTGWLVEFEWKESGKLRKGVAPITSSRNVKPNQKPLFSQGGWAMVTVIEDMGPGSFSWTRAGARRA